MKPEVIQQLKEIVGNENVYTEAADLFCYTYDGSFIQGDPMMPGAVVLPANTKEVSRILKLAGEYNMPIVPRGAGTNLSGGTLPAEGSIILQMTRMDRIIKIDKRNMMAIVEPGVINGEFQKELANHDLFYPPDPASMAYSTMGGNVAECAGGPKGVKYGVTKDYVLGLEVVMADGTIIKTGAATMKSVAGYDLTHLFTGSEGTLCVITQIKVKLLPRPKAEQTMLVAFNDLDRTTETVVEILAQGIIPSTLEFMDKVCIKSIENYIPSGLPLDAEAALLIEVDGPEILLEKQVLEIKKICYEQGAIHIRTASSLSEKEKLWQGRKGVFGAFAREYPTILAEDITVPLDKIPDAVRKIKEIGQRHQLEIAVIAHAGDGNLHADILTDERDEKAIKRVNQALEELFRVAVELGGTITGEHGIGLSKVPFLPMEVGNDGMRVMQAIKKALDPQNILNPGKIFGNRGW